MRKRDCWPHHFDCDHRKYIGELCFLNGKVSKICKTPEGFAIINPLDTDFGGVEYSWIAVFNVMENRDCVFGE